MFGWINGMADWVAGLFGVKKPGVPSEQVAAIQAAAVRACGFLPLAETVANIVGQANPGVLTATSAANYICRIVTKTPPAAMASAQTLVGGGNKIQSWVAPDGTVISGSFVGTSPK